MQPPPPPRGPYPGGMPGGMPPPLGRTNPSLPSLGQSSFGGPPLPPGPPPGMGGPPGLGGPPGMGPAMPPGMQTAPGLAPVMGGPMVGMVRRQPVFWGFRKMRRGEMYPLTVRIEAEGGAKATEAGLAEPQVTVQPVIPGAMVTPNSSDILLQPGAEAIFSVLPMTSGKMKGARIDILRQGRKLTSLNVPMRVASNWLSPFLLLLTGVLLLLLWSNWEPKYTQITETLVPPTPQLSPDGNPLPVAPDAKPEIRRVETQFEGTEAIEKFLAVNTGRLGYGPDAVEQPLPMREWRSFDYFVVGLNQMKPALIYAWQGVETLRKTPMGDLYLIGVMALLILLLSFLFRPRRSRLPGPMLEVRA